MHGSDASGTGGPPCTGVARLAALLVHEHTRSSLLAEVRQALHEEFGPTAELHLAGDSLESTLPRSGDRKRIPVEGIGTVDLPAGADADDFVDRLRTILETFDAIEQERARATRVASLYEFAHQLAAELDVDRTLTWIVERAKEVTGADACYLSLNDAERGETYFRATAGIRTEGFRRLRLKYGHGLGGLVAKEGRPYSTSDYLGDARFVHVADPQVIEEGIVSVLGVPLRAGDTVMGVLFVANRHASTFADDDVAFCEALAEHAAIAIANAQLFARLERQHQLHERLTDLVLDAHDTASLARGVSEALGHRVVIETVVDDGKGVGARVDQRQGEMAVPIVAGGVLLGWLVAPDDVGEDRRIGLEQAARVVAVHLLRERAVAQAELRGRSELLAAILDRRLPEPELVERAKHFGLDLSVPCRALVVEGERGAQLRAGGMFVATRLGSTVVILPDDAPLPPVEGVAALGRPGVGAEELAVSIEEATRIAVLGARLGLKGVLTQRDLGIYSVLVDPTTADEVRAQAMDLLRPLLEYDQAHGTSLVETLEAFLDAQGRPKEASERCFVHVNTLYYRLDRIREITQWRLDDVELRLQLHVACRMLRFNGGL